MTPDQIRAALRAKQRQEEVATPEPVNADDKWYPVKQTPDNGPEAPARWEMHGKPFDYAHQGYVPTGRRVSMTVDGYEGKTWYGYTHDNVHHVGYAFNDGIQLPWWAGGLSYVYYWKFHGKTGAEPKRLAWVVVNGEIIARFYSMEAAVSRVEKLQA